MTFNRSLIAPYQTGLVNDLEPWMIPEDAYATLENAFIFRGKLKKRFGYKLMGDTTVTNPQLNARLRTNLGTTNGAGTLSGTVPGTIFKIGQMFSVGDNIFTVNATGTPAATLASGTGTATFNTNTGAFVITTSSIATAAYFYPAEPVMGLRKRENSAINFEQIIAFDTQFAYERSGGAWTRLGTGAVNTWTGSDSKFFWTTNYQGVASSNTNMYVTNFNFNLTGATADNIRYLASTGTTFVALRPQLNTGADRFLETGRMVLSFKNRLIVLNTIESSVGVFSQFSNRCRFSQNGDPTSTTVGWLDDTPGRGGFIDASTKQAIVSAEFIKDRLIVYFESSTYELVYTANQILPFRWQKINTELGAESTFSKVPFDKTILTVGKRGIHACSGVDVERIDNKIPDAVFSINNDNNGKERVYGVRDYFTENIYWSYPTSVGDKPFPNRIFVYNYNNHTWAIFKDTFTCFGYFQRTDDTQWQTLSYPSWSSWGDPWNASFAQSEFETIAAGNQQGFTVLIDRDRYQNDEFYQITDYSSTTVTCIDHNLDEDDYIQFNHMGSMTIIIDPVVGAVTLDGVVAKITARIDADSFTVDRTPIGTYVGGGTLKRVSNIDVKTKRYNPYISEGIGFNIPYVDFFVNRTSFGEFTIDVFLNESNTATSGLPDATPGTRILSTAAYSSVTSESFQSRLWHRFYLYSTAFNLQMRYFMSDAQMKDTNIAFADLTVNAIVLTTSPAEKVVS